MDSGRSGPSITDSLSESSDGQLREGKGEGAGRQSGRSSSLFQPERKRGIGGENPRLRVGLVGLAENPRLAGLCKCVLGGPAGRQSIARGVSPWLVMRQMSQAPTGRKSHCRPFGALILFYFKPTQGLTPLAIDARR